MNKKQIQAMVSNYIGIYAIASSITHNSIMQGLPIPAKYPPSHVLIPNKKKVKSQLTTPLIETTRKLIAARQGKICARNTMTIPILKIKSGQQYYNQLKENKR